MALKGSDVDVKRDATLSNIIFAIIGPSGAGKSSFIAQLTGNKSIKIGHDLEPATSEIGHYNYFDKSGRTVTLVDSPGFDDDREGLTVLRNIEAFLLKHDKKLSGIIHLYRNIDYEKGGISTRNLTTIRNLCGEGALENVVVVTTGWDDVPEEDREKLEKWENELMQTPRRFFQPLIAAGGQFLRHENTEESARRIIETLLKNHLIPLQTRIDGKTLETAAGTELAAELKELVDRCRKEMKDLKEEMAVAIAGSAESNRRVKEMEEKAEKERLQLKAETDSISNELAAANKKLQDVEKAQVVAANRSQVEQARIQSLVEMVRKEKEETDRKYWDLLRSTRRQVCHWQPISSTLRSADFDPVPIQAGIVNGVSAFVVRSRTEESNGSVVTDCVQEGCSLATCSNGNTYWDFQVLVGDRSRLIWTPCRGCFGVKSTVHAVPGWEKDVDNVSDTQYIARFIYLGDVYVTKVTESANGVSDVNWHTGVVVNSQDYEVLCYKDL